VASDGPDLIVFVGWEDLGRVADRSPVQRHGRPLRQYGPDVDDAVDLYLGPSANPRAIEDRSIRRQKGVLFNRAADEVSTRPNEHVGTDLDRVVANAPDHSGVQVTQFEPTRTGPLSAVITTPKPMEQFGPMVTSPQITAFGAIRTSGSMVGRAPLCSRIMLLSGRCSSTASSPLSSS
jgi:hypothetical protein